jgi:small subunit ribosomal protein S11
MAEEKETKATNENPPEQSAVKPEGAAAAGGVADAAAVPAPKKVKARSLRTVPSGIAHIKATFNNTMVSITDLKGAVIGWSSAGRTGMKGSRKSTAFAAALVGQDVARQAVGRGMHEVEVRVQGAGAGRESAIRALQSAGLNITVIKDVTPIPHNGCRPRKRRRV